MTEQELGEKLDKYASNAYWAGRRGVDFDVENRQIDELGRLITQYGDTRERDGRIDEVNRSFQAYGLDRKQLKTNIPRDDTIYTSKRLAELKEQV